MNQNKSLWKTFIRPSLLLLLLCGLLLTATGCTVEVSDKITTTNHKITDAFHFIDVECSDCHIQVLPSENDSVTVVCKEREKDPHKVFIKNGVLTVEEPNRTAFLNILTLTGSHTEVTVYLPLDLAATCGLSLDSASGNITLDHNFHFISGELGSASGDITCASSFSKELSIEGASGKITVSNNTYDDMEISNASGNIWLENLANVGNLELEAASGKITLQSVNCKNLEAETASGKITMEDVIADQDIIAETASGAIALLRCDAKEYDLETASGNIEGSLLSPMTFRAESLSGRVNVPNTDGGLCKLYSNSGNITITVEE